MQNISNKLSEKIGYQLCTNALCGKPLVNEANLRIFRIKLGVGGAGIVIGGGLLGAYALPALGFKSAGVAAGSYAAGWQGPAVVAGSVFAICQSLGATGLGTVLFGAVGSAAGGVGALGVLYKYRSEIGWCCCDKCKVKNKL